MIGAADAPPVQPVLLPLERLALLLDRKQDWQLMPLADYRQLVAAAEKSGTESPTRFPAPQGAWIETATVRGRLTGDRELVLTADAVAVAVPDNRASDGASRTDPDGPRRCPLWAFDPTHPGVVTVDGAPGFIAPAPADSGRTCDLILPKAGRFALKLAWSVRLDKGNERLHRGALVLPLAAGIDVVLESVTPGAFSADGMDEQSGGRWQLVRRPFAPVLGLAWAPGSSSGRAETVWGLDQAVEVVLPGAGGSRPLRWLGRIETRRGEAPTHLVLRLPAGWIATEPGPGVVAMATAADGLHLTLAAGTKEASFTGFATGTGLSAQDNDPDTALTLPTVAGALYQGGTLVVRAPQPFAATVPVGWREQSAPDGSGPARAWRLAAPVGALGVIPSAADGLTTELAATLTIGDRRWRIDERLVITAGTTACFAFNLQLPSGWTVTALSGRSLRSGKGERSDPLTIPGLSDGGGVEALTPGALVPVRVGRGLAPGASIEITMTCERDAPAVADAAAVAAATNAGTNPAAVEVMLAHLPRAVRHAARLAISAAPGIDLDLSGSGWRLLDPQERGSSGVRAELAAVAPAAKLALVASVRPPTAQAEAVVYVLPAPSSAVASSAAPSSAASVGAAASGWCRIDLRLRAPAGEVGEILLDAPMLAVEGARVNDRSVALERDGTRWRLKPNAPWRGERLLRLDGRLAAGWPAWSPSTSRTASASATASAELSLPRIEILLSGGTEPRRIAVRQTVVVQAPDELDVQVKTAAGAGTLGEDDLPAWTRPIPGEPVVAVVRAPVSGAIGVATLVERPLAGAPSVFIAELAVESQLDTGGANHLLRLRLAAPGLDALPIVLPAGIDLVRATVDGAAVAVRRTAAGLALPVPGRTQLQVALWLREAGARELGNREETLLLPTFPGVPVIRTRWELALPEALRARVVVAGDTMPLASGFGRDSAQRPWFGAWRGVSSAHRQTQTGWIPPPRPSTDVRVLNAAQPMANTTQAEGVALAEPDPALNLAGTLLAGERSGVPRAAVLRLEALPDLVAWDRLGQALAVILGCWLALRRSWRLAGSAVLAGLATAFVCHHVPHHGFGLMALGEWLPAALAGWALLLSLARPLARRAVASAALLVVFGFTSAAGVATAATASESPGPASSAVLMGYARLDAKGVPEDVRVALSRAQLDNLWQRAHPKPEEKIPVCALATGLPEWKLTGKPGAQKNWTIEALLRVPYVVPGSDWQELQLKVPKGGFVSLRRLPFPANLLGKSLTHSVSSPDPVWKMSNGAVVLSLAPATSGIIELTTRMDVGADTILSHSGLGGRVSLEVPAGWTIDCWDVVPDPGANPNASSWHGHLSVGSTAFNILISPATAVAPRTLRLSLDQRLKLVLLPDRLEWSARAQVTANGAGVRDLRLDLPAGLALTNAEAPGMVGWKQAGAVLELSFPNEQSGAIPLTLAGVMPRGERDTVAVQLALSGAERSAGRLGLRSAAPGQRLGAAGGQERAEPEGDEESAVRWHDRSDVTVRWSRVNDDLHGRLDTAVVPGPDRIRALIAMSLSGRGELSVLRLPVPKPWRLVRLGDGLVAAARKDAAGDTTLELVARRPLVAGSTVAVLLEADRQDLGAAFALPGAGLTAEGLAIDRRTWLVAESADRHLRLTGPTDANPVPVAPVAAAFARQSLTTELHGSAREPVWQQALEARSAEAPRASWVDESARLKVSASHYLLVVPDLVRWSVRMQWTVESGAVERLRLRLPESAHLVSLACRDLGSWSQDGRELTVRLVAPARGAVAVDLELEAPFASDARAQVAAVLPLDGTLATSQVAVVVDDDLGQVNREANGLETVEKLNLPLPQGIDAAQVKIRYVSARSDWSLALRREVLAVTAGVDAVAPLLEAITVIAPDGECRTRAVWHVINHTRQQLRLVLPTGVELWQVRVDGRPARPRHDHAGSVWVPVRPLRPGEATTRIELTWRQQAFAADGRLAPAAPVFPDLRLMQVAWRFVPPSGDRLRLVGGALTAAAAMDVQALGAQRVVDEIRRLKAQGNLNDNGLKRLSDNLAASEIELNDYLGGGNRANGQVESIPGRNGNLPPANVQVPNAGINTVNGNQQLMQVNPMANIFIPNESNLAGNPELLNLLNREKSELASKQMEVQGTFGLRDRNRKAQGKSNYNQVWDNESENLMPQERSIPVKPVGKPQTPPGKPVPPPPSLSTPASTNSALVRQQQAAVDSPQRSDLPAPLAASRAAWNAPLTIGAGDQLGLGENPNQVRVAATGLLGIDLLDDRPGDGLWLKGGGSDLTVILEFQRPGLALWPWLAVLVALAAGVACVVVIKRPAR